MLWPAAVFGQTPPRRVLYITHSAGFVHGSIVTSRQAFDNLAAESGGALQIVASEDLSLLNAASLRNFDVVFFFTSGNLPLSNQQRQDLLDFVRGGKGFGGVHSATDTSYDWPEYGQLIGAYFDEHPWAQEVSIDVEDPDHPAMRHLGSSFRVAEEIYQFTSLSRDRVRVLMTLDTRTVDLRAPLVKRTDGDFALAWCHNFGGGRVFYTALGHTDEIWRDPRFQTLMRNALLWLAGDLAGDATPRGGSATAPPRVAAGGVVNGASFAAAPENFVAPGSLISIFGAGLTSGSTLQAASLPLPVKLAGTSVSVNGAAIPLLYVSPGQINAQLPFEAGRAASLAVSIVNRTGTAEPLRVASAAPGIFAALAGPQGVTIFATGLGAVRPAVATGAAAPLSPLSRTIAEPEVTIGGQRATVSFSGLAPLFAGLYQVNAMIPAATPTRVAAVVIEMGGRQSNAFTVRIPP